MLDAVSYRWKHLFIMPLNSKQGPHRSSQKFIKCNCSHCVLLFCFLRESFFLQKVTCFYFPIMKSFPSPQEARCQSPSAVKLCLLFCLWQVMKDVSLSDLESLAPKNSKNVPRAANRTIWRRKEEHSLKNKLIPGSLSTRSYGLTLCSVMRSRPLDNVKCGPMSHLYFLFWKSTALL